MRRPGYWLLDGRVIVHPDPDPLGVGAVPMVIFAAQMRNVVAAWQRKPQPHRISRLDPLEGLALMEGQR